MSSCSFIPYSFNQNLKDDLTLQSLIKKNEDHNFSIFGYPDDEGILNNGGKVGAALGPDSIRASLYKMTPSKKINKISIKDFGNLSFKSSSLKQRHIYALRKVEKELLNNKTCISFGGGHDYAYADGSAFLKNSNSPKPLIVNFDAHFDLRNLDRGISSGTPFFRLLKEFGSSFDLYEVGIQKQCNSKNLFDFADSKENIKTLHYNDLYPDHSFNFSYFKNSLPKEKKDCYISVDIDGFSSAFAPGCSQSWPTGFDINSFFKMFNYLIINFNVKLLGIYEVSPPLDHTELTSRLAALITYRFLELKA